MKKSQKFPFDFCVISQIIQVFPLSFSLLFFIIPTSAEIIKGVCFDKISSCRLYRQEGRLCRAARGRRGRRPARRSRAGKRGGHILCVGAGSRPRRVFRKFPPAGGNLPVAAPVSACRRVTFRCRFPDKAPLSSPANSENPETPRACCSDFSKEPQGGESPYIICRPFQKTARAPELS